MKDLISKDRLIEKVRITDKELDFLVTKDVLATKNSKVRNELNGEVRYNPKRVAKLIKTKEFKDTFGLTSTKELHSLVVEKGVFSGNVNTMSDRLGYAIREKGVVMHIDTTLEHKKGAGKKQTSRLFRTEEAIEFLINSEIKKEKSFSRKLEKINSDQEKGEPAVSTDAFDNEIALLKSEIDRLKKSLNVFNNRLDSIELNQEGWRDLTSNEIKKGAYVLSNVGELKIPPSDNQRAFLESLSAQLNSNPNKARTGRAGRGIIEDFYAQLTNKNSRVYQN
jgi:uncharacterized small protein (DUF1192 family)